MYLLTLILGIVLLHEASTLRCYQCIPGETGTCNETITQCPLLENECAALRVVTYSGSSKVLDDTYKSCILPEECGEHSINFGFARQVVTVKCCTSDLCNTQPAPEPTPTAPNGKKCFGCDGLTCTSTLNCLGDEDYCISVTGNSDGTNFTSKGCTSRIFCPNTRATITGISCCEGDFCNGVSSTTVATVTETIHSRGVSTSSTSAGLLLLVTPLISLILN